MKTKKLIIFFFCLSNGLLSSCSNIQSTRNAINLTYPEGLLRHHINDEEIRGFIKSIDEEPTIYDEEEITKKFDYFFNNLPDEQEESSDADNKIIYTYNQSGIKLIFVNNYLNEIDIYLEKNSEEGLFPIQKFNGTPPLFLEEIGYYPPIQVLENPIADTNDENRNSNIITYVYLFPETIYEVYSSDSGNDLNKVIIKSFDSNDLQINIDYKELFLDKESIPFLSPNIKEVNDLESKEENFLSLALNENENDSITAMLMGIYIFETSEQAESYKSEMISALLETGYDGYYIDDYCAIKYNSGILIRKDDKGTSYILNYNMQYRNVITEITYIFPTIFGREHWINIITPIAFFQIQNIILQSVN